MTRSTFTIAVALFCGTAAATPPPITIISSCECRGNHGKGRLTVKNDPSTPPTDAGSIQAITPSDMFSWPRPDVRITRRLERTGIENQWFALTGRVVAVQVEADGDLHIELADATGNKPGIIICEVPAKPQWCDIRTTVFSWTPTRFPLHIRSTRKLTLNEAPIITVVGKAFWDIGHAPKRWIKPQKEAAPICCLGDSSGDGVERGSVNRWGIAVFCLASPRRDFV